MELGEISRCEIDASRGFCEVVSFSSSIWLRLTRHSVYVYLITGTYLRLPSGEWSRANAVCHYCTVYRKSDVATSPKESKV